MLTCLHWCAVSVQRRELHPITLATTATAKAPSSNCLKAVREAIAFVHPPQPEQKEGNW